MNASYWFVGENEFAFENFPYSMNSPHSRNGKTMEWNELWPSCFALFCEWVKMSFLSDTFILGTLINPADWVPASLSFSLPFAAFLPLCIFVSLFSQNNIFTSSGPTGNLFVKYTNRPILLFWVENYFWLFYFGYFLILPILLSTDNHLHCVLFRCYFWHWTSGCNVRFVHLWFWDPQYKRTDCHRKIERKSVIKSRQPLLPTRYWRGGRPKKESGPFYFWW